MWTAMDSPIERLDAPEKVFIENIRNHGWFGTHVFSEGDSLAFSYTTGLWLREQAPELVVFSLDQNIAHQILCDIVNDLRNGKAFPRGAYVPDIFANGGAYFFPVAKRHYRLHFGWSRWFYDGDEFPCLQLVWPDREGRFPWQDGVAEGYRELQPDLTENGWLGALAQ